VLEAERFPHVLIHVMRDPQASPSGTTNDWPPGQRLTPAGPESEALRIAITLHGTTRDFLVPARIEPLPDGIVVEGRVSFNQTDFGLVPLSVLGGALQVRDALAVRFRVVATAKPQP
jgi:hypothetical protein